MRYAQFVMALMDQWSKTMRKKRYKIEFDWRYYAILLMNFSTMPFELLCDVRWQRTKWQKFNQAVADGRKMDPRLIELMSETRAICDDIKEFCLRFDPEFDFGLEARERAKAI